MSDEVEMMLLSDRVTRSELKLRLLDPDLFEFDDGERKAQRVAVSDGRVFALHPSCSAERASEIVRKVNRGVMTFAPEDLPS